MSSVGGALLLSVFEILIQTWSLTSPRTYNAGTFGDAVPSVTDSKNLLMSADDGPTFQSSGCRMLLFYAISSTWLLFALRMLSYVLTFIHTAQPFGYPLTDQSFIHLHSHVCGDIPLELTRRLSLYTSFRSAEFNEFTSSRPSSLLNNIPLNVLSYKLMSFAAFSIMPRNMW